MDSKTYVLKHDYGYGREIEITELNRLNLRNIEDLQVYLQDLLQKELICTNNVLITIKSANIEVGLVKK